MKIDRFEYAIETNSAPTLVSQLNDLPIRTVNGAVIYVRDVAHVRDGNPPQTNIVRVDGSRAILMSIMKTGSASTLDIIAGIRSKLESITGQLPPQLKISFLSDQSIFVRSAISGVVREAIVAACLTAVMILVFLGSMRSTSHHRGLHSALDFVFARLARRSSRDHQHHDPGRTRPRRRHPRRRCHRRNREHQPQSRIGQGDRAGHPRWRRADCHPGARLNPVHLHCVCAHVPPQRRGPIPVRAACRGRGFRHAGQLPAFAHRRAHHGQIPAPRA